MRSVRSLRSLQPLRPLRPPLNFITVHYAYFTAVTLLASLVFWGSSNPQLSISYVDSLFLVVSAMTEAGLNTVNLSQMTTWQQILLWLLIIIGSSIWVSIWTVLVRKHTFERRFKEIVKKERERSQARPNANLTLLPITQRLRSIGRSRNAPATVPLDPYVPYASARSSDPERGNMPPISAPISMRLISAVVPQLPSGQAGLGEGLPHPARPLTPQSDPEPETEHRSIAGNGATGTDNVSSPSSTPSEHVAFAEEPPGRAITSSLAQRHQAVPRHVSNTDAYSLARVTSRQPEERYIERHVGNGKGHYPELTVEERERLGGTEYRALRLLSIVVPVYFVSWQVLGSVALAAWIAVYQPQPALDNAISPWWNGIFNGVSAFNNSGMSVLDANMIPYGSSYFVLIVMGVLILAGNTAYPIFLRFWLWSGLEILKLVSYQHDFVEWKTAVEYILKYPRRVYTNLFPARQTWWLLFMLFVLNGTDWVAFEILNLGNPSLDKISPGSRVIDGLFQALAVRSGGFYVVSIPTLYVGIQVLYVIMMYIAVYPVVITMRHSNVYEERSLGIYDGWHDPDSDLLGRPPSRRRMEGNRAFVGRLLRRAFLEWHGVGAVTRRHDDVHESRISFISHQIRGQLSHDLWWLVLAVLAIMIIETRHFLEDPVTFSVFNVVFEVVSAYGCVGISVGLPNQSYSLSGGLYPGSKLILCAVMLRGRHRGLPVALDRAVRLPGDEMHRLEEDDNNIRRSMSTRRPSVGY